jgi:histidyl-tRNA synthetase
MSVPAPVRALKGMKDVLWPESYRWEVLVSEFAGLAQRAGYGLTITPVLEEARLFHRGFGDESEVVVKEMYEFDDRDKRRLALRPEGTAPIVRAFIEHHPSAPWKAWYVTPAFRHEQPQAGRFRQHHQIGVEAIGTEDPDLDVEVVSLAASLYRDLGLRRVSLAVNSMGCGECRQKYTEALRAFLIEHRDELCDEHKLKLDRPLRVLDCKRSECRAVTEKAPRLVDFLDAACAEHFARFNEGLDAAGIEHHLEPRLVRGFDYYTRTTFEFAAEALEAAQNAVGGGGRYDGLAEQLGGDPAPGIGFGIGIERLLLACDAEGCFEVRPPGPAAFVVDLTGGAAARDLCEELRRAGLGAERAFDRRSMRAQLKLADRSGARVALIIGPDELSAGEVTLRELRTGGTQRRVARSRVADELRLGSSGGAGEIGAGEIGAGEIGAGEVGLASSGGADEVQR